MSRPAAPPALPEWLPAPEQGACPVPCGKWFDAVTVDAFDGIRALAHLADRSGPILEDRAGNTMAWLVAPGCAEGWPLRGMNVRRRGNWLTVPPVVSEGPLRWQRVPPDGQEWLTRPTQLRGALAAVLLPASARPGVRRG